MRLRKGSSANSRKVLVDFVIGSAAGRDGRNRNNLEGPLGALLHAAEVAEVPERRFAAFDVER